jgi:NTE family protein
MFGMRYWSRKPPDTVGDSGNGAPEGANPAKPPDFRPPVIGVALGAGAARGWAHIGILNALIENGIVPEVIVGTSIGAVIGGCCAAGKLDQLTHFALGLTKRRVFSLMDLNLSGSGLISGHRLRRMLDQGLGDLTIEQLATKFAAVTTEYATGHEMWLTSGHLVTAMRASYAIPGIFEPLNVGGRWLLDGALVNPVPVSVARALGAELVISVSLNADHNARGTIIQEHFVEPAALLPEQPQHRIRLLNSVSRAASAMSRLSRRQGSGPSMAHVMLDAINITQDRIARSRLAGDPPDVALHPRLSKIGLFEFQRAEESIEIGRESVEQALPDIRNMVDALQVSV